MNTARFGIAGTALLLSLAACAPQPGSAPAPGGAQPPGGPSAAPSRAASGDTVYVVEHDVLPERRDQFEQFVDNVLWPALQRAAAANPARGHILRQTRLLRPLAPNDDGTFTYTFILDPVVPGESYNVLDLLHEVHAEEEAKQLYGRFTETWAREFRSRPFVQGRESSSS